MKVSEVMSKGVQSVRLGTPAATARERMRAKQIHHLLRSIAREAPGREGHTTGTGSSLGAKCRT